MLKINQCVPGDGNGLDIPPAGRRIWGTLCRDPRAGLANGDTLGLFSLGGQSDRVTSILSASESKQKRINSHVTHLYT